MFNVDIPGSNYNSEKYDYLLKIIFIGNMGVGKSSVISRFSHDVFTTEYTSTIGIDFKIKTIFVNGKRVKLQLWDTSGQERFNAITTSFYRSATGAIMMYDITDYESFNKIAKWNKDIDEYAEDRVEKMLIGNKCDLEEKRQVHSDIGHALAERYKAHFFETSAKSSINVETAMTKFVKAIVDKLTVAQAVNKIENAVPVKINKETRENRRSCCSGLSKN